MEDYQELAKQPERRGTADFCLVTPGYFPALGIRIKSGRDFDTRDGLDAPHAAVISETLARTQWPGQDPLGRTLQFGNMDGYLQLLTVVGVAADLREDGPEAPPRPIVYGNLLQRPRSAFSIILRTASDSPAILSTARTLLRAEAPDAPPRFRSFDSLYAAALGSRRFNLLLVGFFALSALLLAVAGVYGVTAYGVAQRTREIGVRMALGALPSQVTGLILREESRMALAGILAGGLGAVALLRAMRSLLYGVTETDPLTLLAVAALLALVALGACFVPVRRAARLDPLTALRDE
jgi:putative ABC transport system permease protein